MLVVGRGGESDAYLNTYRRLISDVILSVGCDAEGAIRADLRLLPLEELSGRVAVFTAGATDASHLAADVVHVSANLADRAALRRELEGLDADTYLVEVKAAAIDVVAEHALERGKRVVLAANELVGDGVDDALASLAPARAAAVRERRHGEPLPLGDADLPYSKGLMARALIATGVPADRAYQLARRVEVDLAERRESTVDLERLRGLAREDLGDEEGERAVTQLQRLAELQSLDVPIIVLIGGSTGTGKSTVAAEVAHRLGITRVASTDFIRQTMRAFFSREFMPTIHYSSFEAGEAVDEDVTGDPTVVGFVDQCRHVCVGVEAAIHRSLTEGWSMVHGGRAPRPGAAAAARSRAR